MKKFKMAIVAYEKSLELGCPIRQQVVNYIGIIRKEMAQDNF